MTTETIRLTREAIRLAEDIDTVEVLCPEWGGSVFVRGMTGEERADFEKFIQTPIDIDDLDIPRAEKRRMKRMGAKPTGTADRTLREMVCYWSCVDEAGDRLFKKEDLPWLSQKSAAPLERIMDVVGRISGFTDTDIEELASKMVAGPLVTTTSC